MRSDVSDPIVARAQNVTPLYGVTSYGTLGPVYVPPSGTTGG